MKKNKKELMERYIYLEEWLKNNYPINMTDNEILEYFMKSFNNKHDIEYLIEAYFLPREEFINESYSVDSLSKKYSVSKDKINKRISDINNMNAILKEKMIKPKMELSIDNISDLIDDYIKKNRKDELDRKVILEKWLEENYIADKDSMINYIYMVFNENDAEYLSRAYLMPRSDVIGYMNKYNVQDGFEIESMIEFLVKEYELPRKEVVARIEEAVVIDSLIKEEKKAKKRVKERIK